MIPLKAQLATTPMYRAPEILDTYLGYPVTRLQDVWVRKGVWIRRGGAWTNGVYSIIIFFDCLQDVWAINDCEKCAFAIGDDF